MNNFKTFHSRDRPAYLYTSTPATRKAWLQAPAMAYTILSQRHTSKSSRRRCRRSHSARASLSRRPRVPHKRVWRCVTNSRQSKLPRGRVHTGHPTLESWGCGSLLAPLATQVGALLLKLGLSVSWLGDASPLRAKARGGRAPSAAKTPPGLVRLAIGCCC